MSLLDTLKPRTIQPAAGRLITFGNTEKPADRIEREKEGQRRHWAENDRRRRQPGAPNE